MCINSPDGRNHGNEPTPAPKAGKTFTKSCRVFDDKSSECDGAFTMYSKAGTGEQREEGCAFCTITGPKNKKTTCVPSGSTHYLVKSANKSEKVVCSIYSEENGDDDYVARGGGSLAADDDSLKRMSTDDETGKNDDGGKNNNDNDDKGDQDKGGQDNLSSTSEANGETTGLIVGIVILAVALAITGVVALYYLKKHKEVTTTTAAAAATTGGNNSTAQLDVSQSNPMHQDVVDVEKGSRMAPRKTATPRFSKSYGSPDDDATEFTRDPSHASFSGTNPMQDAMISTNQVQVPEVAPPIPPRDAAEDEVQCVDSIKSSL